MTLIESVQHKVVSLNVFTIVARAHLQSKLYQVGLVVTLSSFVNVMEIYEVYGPLE
jgi:hypothetical protein